MPPHVGYLFKKGGSRGNWRKRYFILTDDELSYFASPEMTLKPLGTINLKGCRIERDNAEHRQRSEHVFVILPPGSRAEGSRVFFLSAETENDMNAWMLALKKAAGGGGGGAPALPFPNPTELLSDAAGNKFYRALKEGSLEVQDGRGLGKWRTRFVVCRKNVLLLFESKDAVAQHGAVTVIPLLNSAVEVQQPQKKLLNSSAYRSVSRKVGIESRREFKWNIQHTQRKHFLLSAPNDSIMSDWIAVCAAAIGQAPVSRLPGDEAADTFLATIGAVMMSGELTVTMQGRQGGQSAAERKFVVLSENVLFLCRDSKAPDAHNALELENATVREGAGPGQFLVCYMAITSFQFDCRSANLRAAWMDALARGIELGKRLNVEARVRLNGGKSVPGGGVVREVEQFSEDRSKYEAVEDDYATTQTLDEVATVSMPLSETGPPPSAAPQRPVWGKKPSKMLAVRESKAVGQYRKPALDRGLMMKGEEEENDEILDLLNDPIFSGKSVPKSPRGAAAATTATATVAAGTTGSGNRVCLNCGLIRLEVEANFCDGCGTRFTEKTLNTYDDEDENLDDVVSLDDSEKAFLEANGTSEAELGEVKRELMRVSTMDVVLGKNGSSGKDADKKKAGVRQPPQPPAEERRASRVLSDSFRPARNSAKHVSQTHHVAPAEDDDDFYSTSLPPLPATVSESNSDEERPTPPPRSSADRRKMQLEANKKKLDDEDPLALLDLLDWDAEPAPSAKKGGSLAAKEAEKQRLLREEREVEEADERRRAQAEEKRRRDREREEEAAEQRRLEDKRRREREREAEEERRREEAREQEEKQRARELKEREEKLKRMERELQEKEQEAARREEAARQALREAEELKRKARQAEEERARREEEIRLRKEEEIRLRKEEEQRQRAEAQERAEREAERARVEQAEKAEKARKEAERRQREEELERKETEMRQRAADLARREREAAEAKREAERRRQEEELARKEAEMMQRAAELARREKEALEAQERARREAERNAQEAERARQEMERVEALEKSRKARDAAKKAKEAKERELAEIQRREEAERQEQERQRVAREEAERQERLRRIEEERKRKEAQEEREREEQRRKEAEWAELRSKMDKQREKETAPPVKRGPKVSPEDAAAIEKLKTLLANEFIDRKEYEVRLAQITSRYPSSGSFRAEEEKSVVVAAAPPPVTAAAVAGSERDKEKPKNSADAVAMRARGQTVSHPCPKCAKPVNVQKKFCPHCGFDASKQATPKKAEPAKQQQHQQQQVKPMKIPNGLKTEDLEACLKLRDLLDNDLMSVAEFNARVQNIAARSSVNLESVAQQMEARQADVQLDEFSRALSSGARPAVRQTAARDDDDAELLRSIGLASEPRVAHLENQQQQQQQQQRPKKTVHDEGLSELDMMLKELGE